MCWVMPPASPAATSVWRMASSSEVLPWSTWPRMVTTGGRDTRSPSASSKVGLSGTSSAACWISIFLSRPSASTSIASSESVWVRVAISPSSISFLITSWADRPSDSATCLTVAPDCTSWTWISGSRSGCAVRSGSTHGVRRRRPRRRGGDDCWGGGPGERREAWESITTRRRRPPPPPPPPPEDCSPRGRLRRLRSPTAAVGGLGWGWARRRRAGALSAVAASAPLAASLRGAPSKATAMSFSSTLDAAAFTSKPAAWSLTSTSLLGMPRSFAISWTLFFAISL